MNESILGHPAQADDEGTWTDVVMKGGECSLMSAADLDYERRNDFSFYVKKIILQA